MEIGDYTSINYGVEIHSKVRVTIGRYLLMAWNVTIVITSYSIYYTMLFEYDQDSTRYRTDRQPLLWLNGNWSDCLLHCIFRTESNKI